MRDPTTGLAEGDLSHGLYGLLIKRIVTFSYGDTWKGKYTPNWSPLL